MAPPRKSIGGRKSLPAAPLVVLSAAEQRERAREWAERQLANTENTSSSMDVEQTTGRRGLKTKIIKASEFSEEDVVEDPPGSPTPVKQGRRPNTVKPIEEPSEEEEVAVPTAAKRGKKPRITKPVEEASEEEDEVAAEPTPVKLGRKPKVVKTTKEAAEEEVSEPAPKKSRRASLRGSTASKSTVEESSPEEEVEEVAKPIKKTRQSSKRQLTSSSTAESQEGKKRVRQSSSSKRATAETITEETEDTAASTVQGTVHSTISTTATSTSVALPAVTTHRPGRPSTFLVSAAASAAADSPIAPAPQVVSEKAPPLKTAVVLQSQHRDRTATAPATPEPAVYLPVKTEDVVTREEQQEVNAAAMRRVAEDEAAELADSCSWCSSVCSAPIAYYVVVALVLAAWCVLLYGDGTVAAMSTASAFGISLLRRVVKVATGSCCPGEDSIGGVGGGDESGFEAAAASHAHNE